MTWLLKLILPRADRGAVLGDLAEESALQDHPGRWFRRQVLRSLGPIVWANIRRGVWLKMLGAALAGYLVVVVVVVATAWAAPLLSLVIGFAATALGGFLAAQMYPRAAVALARLVLVMGVVSLIVTGNQAPLWYQLSLIVIGPIAALAGGRIRELLRRRV